LHNLVGGRASEPSDETNATSVVFKPWIIQGSHADVPFAIRSKVGNCAISIIAARGPSLAVFATLQQKTIARRGAGNAEILCFISLRNSQRDTSMLLILLIRHIIVESCSHSPLNVLLPALVFSAALQEGTIGREIKCRLSIILGEFVQIVNFAPISNRKIDPFLALSNPLQSHKIP